jgi:hypothetical protein
MFDDLDEFSSYGEILGKEVLVDEVVNRELVIEKYDGSMDRISEFYTD